MVAATLLHVWETSSKVEEALASPALVNRSDLLGLCEQTRRMRPSTVFDCLG